MSEINSLLEQNPTSQINQNVKAATINVRSSESKERPRSILKNKINLNVCSPKIHQFNTNFNNYNRTCTNATSNSRKKSKENTLTISDLRQK